MKIQLKGQLHPELELLGFRPGDIIQSAQIHKNKAAHFEFHGLAVPQNCSVWPENYDILKD